MSGTDKWLDKLDHALGVATDCEGSVETRKSLARDGHDVSKINSTIRRFLNELAVTIQELEDLLNTSASQYHITDEQYTRRQQNIAELKTRRDDLQLAYSRGQGAPNTSGRSGSTGRTGSAGYRPGPSYNRYDSDRGAKYTNNAYGGYDNEDDHFQRQQMIQYEQDQQIDVLAESIARQKKIGLAIHDELEVQDEMLDDLHEGMLGTDSNLRSTTERVITITERAKGGGLCCCIALLILAIIIVSAT